MMQSVENVGASTSKLDFTAKQTQANHLTQLSRELLLILFKNLGYPSLNNTRLTCKKLNGIVDNNCLALYGHITGRYQLRFRDKLNKIKPLELAIDKVYDEWENQYCLREHYKGRLYTNKCGLVGWVVWTKESSKLTNLVFNKMTICHPVYERYMKEKATILEHIELLDNKIEQQEKLLDQLDEKYYEVNTEFKQARDNFKGGRHFSKFCREGRLQLRLLFTSCSLFKKIKFPQDFFDGKREVVVKKLSGVAKLMLEPKMLASNSNENIFLLLRCGYKNQKYERSYLHLFLRTLDKGLHMCLWTPLFSIRYTEMGSAREIPTSKDFLSIQFQTETIPALLKDGTSGDIFLI